MSDPANTYRDATYSAKTQGHLRSLLKWLALPAGARGNPTNGEINALANVISRWDANEATEMVSQFEDYPEPAA